MSGGGGEGVPPRRSVENRISSGGGMVIGINSELACDGVTLGLVQRCLFHISADDKTRFRLRRRRRKCRILQPSGIPSESRHLSTTGHLVSPTVLPICLSGVGCSLQPNGRGGCVFICLPPCGSCGTNLALCGHAPRYFATLCRRSQVRHLHSLASHVQPLIVWAHVVCNHGCSIEVFLVGHCYVVHCGPADCPHLLGIHVK